MKSRFGASLEPFTLIRISFHEKENRDLVSLSTSEILKSNFKLNAQVETAEVLAYIGELVAEFAPPHEADERLFRMVAACLEALSMVAGAERAITRYFEIWLLRLAGLFPDLRSCNECGAPFEETAVPYVDGELRARCVSCRPNFGSVLSAEVLSTVRATQQLSPQRFVEHYKLSALDETKLSDVTHRLITRAIERRPRTLVAATR